MKSPKFQLLYFHSIFEPFNQLWRNLVSTFCYCCEFYCLVTNLCYQNMLVRTQYIMVKVYAVLSDSLWHSLSFCIF